MTSKTDWLREMRERKFAEARKQEPAEKADTVNKVNKIVTVNKGGVALLTSNAKHQAKWRQANTELNRQRAREGMRKFRQVAL